ncbi:MAG: transposase [Flavobacteriales bacterium]|nr:transposase [Flavobacteriales bacterium]MBK6550894.1 transposase [Flavobacteriales bacterium]MBK6882449.1 transposase [Flavobacteriales bacterium]MBK7101337.1 transposase [Flavobacteriales bacterium]MBK7112045.1 transposase [Flavobacteriales bacterium]
MSPDLEGRVNNGSIRRVLLSAYDFRSLEEVRLRTTEWMYNYNPLRPHKALGYRPPVLIQP